MGKIIELDTEKIIPTQKGLCSTNMYNFFKEYMKNKKDIIIPVKKVKEGHLAIDGHHRACLIDLFKSSNPEQYKIYGWETEHGEDFINELPDNFYQNGNTIKHMNENIEERFHRLIPSQYKSISEMRKDFEHLKSPAKAIKHFGLQKKD